MVQYRQESPTIGKSLASCLLHTIKMCMSTVHTYLHRIVSVKKHSFYL